MKSIQCLENDRVKLSLLDLSHTERLISIANDPDLLQYSPSEVHNPQLLRAYILEALNDFYKGTSIPFIIFDKYYQSYAGSTRFGMIDRENKALHIGWTWLGREFRGTGLNDNVKFLMLEYAFEEMLMHKVEFRIDERNLRSRNAIEKIGAVLEGILREDIVLSDGYRRNSCCYGILKDEWPAIKRELKKKVSQ